MAGKHKSFLLILFVLVFNYCEKTVEINTIGSPEFEKVALVAIQYSGEDAINYYKEHYSDNGNNGEQILNTAGQILASVGKTKESEQILKFALELYPENSTLLTTLGATYVKMMKYDEAIEAFSKAMDILGKDTSAGPQELKSINDRLTFIRNRKIYDDFTGAYQLNNDQLLLFKFDPFLGTYPVFLNRHTGQYEVLYPISERKFYFSNQSTDTLGTLTFSTDGQEFTLEQVSKKSISGSKISIQREPVAFESKGAKIKGNLLLAEGEGPKPAVVLIHGSGYSTRYNFFLEAYFFAANGFSVLVYDKRGSGLSAGSIPLETSYDVLAEDARSAVLEIKKNNLVDKNRIGLWGHSEGGWIIPLTASKSNDIRFAILSAGAAVGTFEQTRSSMVFQMESNNESDSLIADANNYMNQLHSFLKSGKEFDKAAPLIKQARERNWSGYALIPRSEWEYGLWIRLAQHDPAPFLKGLETKTLALFGEQDQSVILDKNKPLMKKYLEESEVDFEIGIIEDANHQFMISGDQYASDYFTLMENFIRQIK